MKNGRIYSFSLCATVFAGVLLLALTEAVGQAPAIGVLSDRSAMLALAQQSEAAFVKSLEAGDMKSFYDVISKPWKDITSVAELNTTFQSLIGLEAQSRYWMGREFILHWPVSMDDNGMLRVMVRYPAPNEHVFIEQVYLQDGGKWKLGGYHLSSRPYHEQWEKFTGEAVVLSQQERFAEAAEAAEKAFRLAAELAPPSPQLVLMSVENLSKLYLAQMDFEPIIAPRLFAVAILEKMTGRDDARIAEQLDQLQVAYIMLGRTNEAAICDRWSRDVRAAGAGDSAAAKRLNEQVGLDQLWKTAPSRMVESSEDPKLVELRAKANAGDVSAQHSLANAYRYGMYGLKEDALMALQWNRRAAEQGYAPSEYLVGTGYEFGRGGEKDLVQAMEWYRRSAEQGFPAAQFQVGHFYEFGKGVPSDKEKALEWYRKAEKAGNPRAASRVKALSK